MLETSSSKWTHVKIYTAWERVIRSELVHMHVYMPAVSLHRVVEVREGQNTAQFDKFPFEKAEKQSFSLIYPQEGTSPTLIVM